jgi:hypothetical protein
MRSRPQLRSKHLPPNSLRPPGPRRKLGPFSFQPFRFTFDYELFVVVVATGKRKNVMTAPVLHVVFTPSGAHSLREALMIVGRDDEVISSFDNYSFGPIDPADMASRAKWVEDELGRTDWDVAAQTEQFWRKSLSREYRKVAWLSRRSAMEYAGFLEWLRQLGDDPCDVVDLTELKVLRHPEQGPSPQATFAVSLAGLSPNEISNNDLFDRAEKLKEEIRNRYQVLWKQLRAENAPLRVIADNELASAPITFFDELLMSYARDYWRKVAMVVGSALVSEMDDCIYQTGDIFLAARVAALVESGRLELQGKSALNMRYSEVRLPKRRG